MVKKDIKDLISELISVYDNNFITDLIFNFSFNKIQFHINSTKISPDKRNEMINYIRDSYENINSVTYINDSNHFAKRMLIEINYSGTRETSKVGQCSE